MNVALDIDDFSVSTPRFEVFDRLKDHFPDFKVSMFMIPCPRRCDYGPYLIRAQTVEEIRKRLDWIQLIPHGVNHESGYEMNRYDQATFKHDALPHILDAFAETGLPYEKGFKAPHWRWSDGVVDALNELGWWGAVLREDKMTRPNRFYRYNYLLNEPFWEARDPVLKLHGHVYGTKNDVGICLPNLLRLPKDTQFSFVTEHLETTW